MTLTINRAPVDNAGPNATICSGTTYTVSGASASNYAGIQWTSNGTGTISNGTTLTPTYTPGAGETGVVTLTLTATPNTGCSTAAVSTMTITINATATASIGVATATICEGSDYNLNAATVSNNNGLLWTTSGTGTFSNPAAVQPIYTPSAADINAGSVTLTLTSYGNSPCPNATSTMVLNINKAPVANAGQNATICIGSTYTISGASANNYASIQWTSNGTGTISNGTTLTPTYTPGTGETGIVTLTLTATPNTGCSTAAISTMTITINATATASIGVATATICEGSDYNFNAATVSNNNGLLWTTSGTGTFNNPAADQPIYTPSAADINAGSVTLTLTSYGNSPCPNATSTMVLNINKAPVANAGQNATICIGSTYTISGASANNYASIQWTSNGTGTISNGTTLTPTYTPGTGETGIVTLTLTATPNTGCSTAAVSTMTITINGTATASIGVATATICEGSDYNLNAATVSNNNGLLWTTSGTGTFSNPAAVQPIYTPSAADINAGSVILTLTSYGNSPCPNATSTMVLYINRSPVANAGANVTICEGSDYTISGASAVNYSSIVWTTNGTGMLINDSTLTPTYMPSVGETGTVTLVLTANPNSGCSISFVSTMTITINESATANIGTSFATICAGSDYNLSTAAVSNNSGLLWTTSGTGTFNNTATLHPIYTPGTADINAGFVTLTLTAYGNSPCGNATSSITLNINRAPLANAGSNVVICAGSDYTISGASASNYSTIVWTSNGTGTLINDSTLTPTYTPGVGETGIVTLTLTANPDSGCASAAISSMSITIHGAATANIGIADTTICGGNDYVINSATVSNNTGILWTTSGTGTFSNNAAIQTIYTPGIADINAGIVTLTLTAYGNVPCGNATSSITLTINKAPEANAGTDASICQGSSYTVSNASASNYSSVHWTNSGSGSITNASTLTPTYTPSSGETGIITLLLAVNPNSGCASVAIDSMTITVNAGATANAGIDTTIQCNSIIHLTGATAANYNSLVWTTSGTGYFNNVNSLNPIYTPSANDIQSGTVILTLTVTGTGVCGSATSSMTLTILPCTQIIPAIGLAKSVESVEKLKDGSYNIRYSIIVKNLGNDLLSNVQVTDNLAVTFPSPTIFNIVSEPIATGALSASITFNGLTDMYLLNSSASTLAIGATDSIKFTVHVVMSGGTQVYYNTAVGYGTGSDGNYVTDISNDGYNPDPNGDGNANEPGENNPTPVTLIHVPIFIPAGFSPNGDGNFDYFVIDGAGNYVVDLKVYNRWGDIVYKQDDYQNTWNGTSNVGINGNGILPDGTYFYIVDLNNGDKPYVGYVTIKR